MSGLTETSKVVCPITRMPIDELEDPVFAPDGHTYERTAITHWLNTHGTSPVSREEMRVEDLIKNRSLAGGGGQKISTTVSEHDFIFVLDISPSMDTEAKITNEQGDKESHGLSLLDIAKHALKALLVAGPPYTDSHVLNEKHRAAFITFSNNAELKFHLQRMTPTNKKKLIEIIDEQSTRGSTALWKALSLALEAAKTPPNPSGSPPPKRTIFFLTDGDANIIPSRGHLPSLIRTVTKMQRNFDWGGGEFPNIQMFGFGTGINSHLLCELSGYLNGGFSFIFDSSFVSTNFCHALGNAMNRTQSNESQNNALKRVKFIECLNTVIQLCKHERQSRFSSTNEHKEVEPTQKHLDAAKQVVKEYQASLSGNDWTLFWEPQVEVALSHQRLWYTWGRHYTRSIRDCHKNRECCNFKDKSIQQYRKNSAWVTTVEAVDETFCEMPAPIPTIQYREALRVRGSPSSASKVSDYTPPTNLRQYSQCDNPCFHEMTLVEVILDSGLTQIPCCKLEKGNKVKVSIPQEDGSLKIGVDTIECVLRTKIHSGTFKFRQLTKENYPSLLVTPWHPLWENGFFFPGDCGGESKTDSFVYAKTSYIYSFVLQNRSPLMTFNGFTGITLAHGIEKDKIASHNFWGTEKVVENLKEISPQGYDEGLVNLEENCCLRQNGRVVKLTKKDRPVVLTVQASGSSFTLV